jgi:hypothetical protein
VGDRPLMTQNAELQRRIFSENSKDFKLLEYEYLRREVEIVIQEHRALERNVLIAIGIAFAWLYTISKTPWLFVILPLIAACGKRRADGIYKAYREFHRYLSEIEEAFWKDGVPRGWEHSLTSGTHESDGDRAFWWILIGLTSLVLGLRVWHKV